MQNTSPKIIVKIENISHNDMKRFEFCIKNTLVISRYENNCGN